MWRARWEEPAGPVCAKVEGNGICGPFLSNAVRVGNRTVACTRRGIYGGGAGFAARTFADYFRRYFPVPAAVAGECGAARECGDALPSRKFILDFDGGRVRAVAGGLVDVDVHRAGARTSFGLHLPRKHCLFFAPGAVYGGAGFAAACARIARDFALRDYRFIAAGYDLDLCVCVFDAAVDLRGAESATLFDSRVAGLHWRKYCLHLRIDLFAFSNAQRLAENLWALAGHCGGAHGWFSGDRVGIAFWVLFFRQHLRSGLCGDVSLAGHARNDGAAHEA